MTFVPQSSLDGFVSRFFEAFDNRNGRIPTCDHMAAFFVERAVILQHLAGETKVMSVAEFAVPRVALLTSGRLRDFFEWETASSTRMFASFAVRTSEYSKSGVLDHEPYEGRGTKLFQLALVGGAWKIASLCWYDEELVTRG